ncbi:MAG: hypothetical protein ACHQRM_11500 [Bacteroidia bacterium]
MRTILLISFLFLAFLQPAVAQTIESDAVLKNIRSQVPEGWVMELKDKKLVIYRKDSVWTKSVNKMNMQAQIKKMNAEERAANFKKTGKRTRAMISYRLDTKWTLKAIKAAEDQNKKTYMQVSRLPAKFKIETLYDSILSEKGGDFYIAKTNEDKVQIKNYEAEKARLLKNIVQVPFLQTEKYSLFPDICTGAEDAFTDVYPEQATSELYKIRNSVTEVCRIQP